VNFTVEEIATTLLAAKGITSGLWRLGVHLTLGGGVHGWTQAGDGPPAYLPTALVGIAGVGLAPVNEPGPLVFDAAELAKQGRTKRKRAPKPSAVQVETK
jgi:hypothetical protein